MKSAVVAAFLLLGCSGARGPASSAPTKAARLTFIEDDYAAARARAREQHVPLFVDAWAPWCHTCLSLRAYVLSDPQIAAHASEFVWLAIDTEKAKNSAFLERFPVSVWPTLWVIDAASEQATLKWLGSATANELASLLEDARSGVTGGDASAAYVRGNRAAASGHADEAILAYRTALDKAPQGWSRRPHVLEALIAELAQTKDMHACTALALNELPSIPEGTSRVNVALTGLGCSDAKSSDRKTLLDAVVAMAMHPTDSVLADDRSGLFESAVETQKADGAQAAAARTAEAWAAYLEGEAKRAPSPCARVVFDAHRLEAYVEMGHPERAVPMLEASIHDFPDDYNPYARLARAELSLGHFDAALANVQRALERVSGPRTLRVLLFKAEIQTAMGNATEARATLEHARTLADKTPLPGGYARYKAEIDRKLR